MKWALVLLIWLLFPGITIKLSSGKVRSCLFITVAHLHSTLSLNICLADPLINILNSVLSCPYIFKISCRFSSDWSMGWLWVLFIETVRILDIVCCLIRERWHELMIRLSWPIPEHSKFWSTSSLQAVYSGWCGVERLDAKLFLVKADVALHV